MANITVDDKTKVGFIASGKMAQAMAKGFISSGMLKPSQLTMSDPRKNQYHILEEMGVVKTQSNVTVVKESTIVFVAVKPHFVRMVLKEVCQHITKKHLIVSIAAGVSLEGLEEECPLGTHVIKVMPNTPCLVQCGLAVYSLGTHATKEDGDLVKSLLSSLGMVEEIPDRLMAPASAVGGCGPAYMYTAIDALADGGVKMGLPRELSKKLAAQMMMGAAKMVLETGEHPGQLKDNVTSPGGHNYSCHSRAGQTGF
ncbi:hypothetical protein EB796_016765 [Bugula neritina]|uniref:Pyrroline-5-carboxylate reductase n=1 Tax=Bugula neritina TaxID=10212 RepID=A0A7J7JHS0_BUGNE|nr:hypothetical protein EB796_016765 [Bugula neritina]